MKPSKKLLTNIPVIVLVTANILPLLGVIFLQWDAFYIILLYWSENLAVGFYNILKIAAARVKHSVEHLAKLFLVPFFMVHYGGFMTVHGLFILTFAQKDTQLFAPEDAWPCFFVLIQIPIGLISHIFSTITLQMKFAVLALFISHGISFVYNYLLKGEYKTAKPKDLMNQPYARVVVLHIAIVAGGFLTMAFGSPVVLLFIFIIGKTILDIKMHLCEHKKAKPAA